MPWDPNASFITNHNAACLTPLSFDISCVIFLILIR